MKKETYYNDKNGQNMLINQKHENKKLKKMAEKNKNRGRRR